MIQKKEIRKAVRAIVTDKDNKVLLIFDKNKDYYSLPGGGIEETDKTEKDAIIREIEEETGYVTKVILDLDYYQEESEKRINKSHGFITKIISVNSKNLDKDEQDFENVWVSLEEAILKIKHDLDNHRDSKYKSFFERELFFLEKAKVHI